MFKCDYDLLVRNVNELNSLTDYNEPKIVEFQHKHGAKFETSRAVRLALYANGICLYDGPFRPFTDGLTKKFCIDIMDGYFPSELQQTYPDGVAFELVDKRDVIFKDPTADLLSSTHGHRLGDKDKEETGARSVETVLNGRRYY